jgi:hypothetical protein
MTHARPLCASASRIALAFLIALASPCYAGQSAQSLIDAGLPAQCSDYAAKVSSSEGSFGSVNQFGCVGAFQFCPGTFEQYYTGSKQSFLNDPSAQIAAFTKYEKDQWALAQKNGLNSLIGKQACFNGTCSTITESSILFACQFGCGANGKLANYFASGDCNARNVKDGNGLSVCSYLQRGSGYDTSCFTGNSSGTNNNGGGTNCPGSGTGTSPGTVVPPTPGNAPVSLPSNLA